MTTLLLDGLWGNSTRLQTMQRRLEAAGMSQIEIFRYKSSGFSCIEAEGRLLADRIAAIGGPVNAVGYSMGGLVIRSARLANPGLSLHRAAFLNTPHSGSVIAWVLPGIGIRQMRPNHSFIRRLAAQEWTIPTLAVWTPGDLMIVPATSAAWKTATQVTKCAVPAHVWPLFSGRIHREIARFLLES